MHEFNDLSVLAVHAIAAMIGNAQDGVEDLPVGKTDNATLTPHTVLNLVVLGFGDFHRRKYIQ